MSDQSHAEAVRRQFGAQAGVYLSSVVHAQGPEFAELRDAVAARPGAQVLDLGCGAGHVSYQVAPLAGAVVAYDLAPEMLAIVAATARERGLGNITTTQGAAEHLPFPDRQFDLVFSRYSAHHWSDLGGALREVHRVLKPGGRTAFVDLAGAPRPLLDTHLQTVEVLRDPSHVRDYTPAEWLQLVAQAGLKPERHALSRLRLEFASWVARMQTPEPLRVAIRTLQDGASSEVRDYFAIEADGSFSADVLVLWASR
ncbi:MAG: methyltransferase domain-containing protein [Porticoccaceae bacterium]